MPFLSVNGITIPVADRRSRRGVETRFRRSRSFRGQMRSAERGHRRRIPLVTCVQEPIFARALECMLDGEGHVFHFFDGLHANTPLKVLPGYKGFVLDPSESGCDLDGDFPGALALAAASGPLLAIDAQLADDEWTLAWCEDAAEPYARRSDGVGFAGAVQDNTVGTPGGPSHLAVEVIDGVVYVDHNLASAATIEVLGVYPCIMPGSMITQWAAAGPQFGPAPVLKCKGDFLEEDRVYCLSRVLRAQYQGAGDLDPAITWTSNGHVIEFDLFELEGAYEGETVLPTGAVT